LGGERIICSTGGQKDILFTDEDIGHLTTIIPVRSAISEARTAHE